MIPLTYLRSSSYNTHDFCPLKFFAEYTLGWHGPSNKKADKGTIVHKALEILACAKKAEQEGRKTYKEPDFLGTIKTTDVMKLDVDDIATQTYYHFATAYDHHQWGEADLKDCIKWTWKAIEFNNGAFDPRKRTIVEAEPHFDLTIDESWAAYNYNGIKGQLGIKGTIDLVTELSPGVYEIVDWKTGRRLNWATGEQKTHAKLRDDFQLRLYHYASQMLYPNIEDIMITIFFINDGGPFTIHLSRADISKTLEMIRTKFDIIRKTKIPRPNKTWKCSKFCHQGTSTFEDTSIEPLAPYGYLMTKCEQLQYALKHRPIELVIQNMTAPGYKSTEYLAPGTT